MSKYTFISLFTLSFALICSSAFAAPSKVVTKGQARFTSTAPLEKIVGTAPVTGQFNVDFKKPEAITGIFEVPVVDMKTGNEMRDDHLRGPEWLNAKKCPKITFEVKQSKVLDFKPSDDKGITTIKAAVEGIMTINCVSKPMKAQAIIKRKGNMNKVGSQFKIALADYNVAGKKGVVGEKVGKSISVVINLKGK